jgi:hypothetical protein
MSTCEHVDLVLHGYLHLHLEPHWWDLDLQPGAILILLATLPKTQELPSSPLCSLGVWAFGKACLSAISGVIREANSDVSILSQ